MAYVRWSREDSDVYVYHDASAMALACVHPDLTWYTRWRTEMVKHLQQHAVKGDRVPQRVYDRLNREREEKGDYLNPPTNRGSIPHIQPNGFLE